MGLIFFIIILGLIYYTIKILRGLDKIDKNCKIIQEKRRKRRETR